MHTLVLRFRNLPRRIVRYFTSENRVFAAARALLLLYVVPGF